MNIVSLFFQWLKGEVLTCHYSTETLTWSWRGCISTAMICGKPRVSAWNPHSQVLYVWLNIRYHVVFIGWACSVPKAELPLILNWTDNAQITFQALTYKIHSTSTWFSYRKSTSVPKVRKQASVVLSWVSIVVYRWFFHVFTGFACASFQSKAQHDSGSHGQRLQWFDLLQRPKIRRKRRLHLSVPQWRDPGVPLRPGQRTCYHQVSMI